jgi:peptidoglycan/xylan/chitin deacetylase (PgdA/CDA1 family)
VMTFDDGYASNLRALPLLEEYGFVATVFVVTGFTESQAPLSWFGIEHSLDPITAEELRPLGWDDLSRLVERGWEVGSHTITHPLLIDLDDDALRSEITCSRLEIVNRLGDCKTLAYPYGVADARVADAAETAGYFGACVLTGAHFTDDPYRRPRVGLTNADAGWRLRAKLSPAGLALRRSGAAQMVRRKRRRRAWQPPRVAGR